ncbi:MAG: hypothetical protein ACT4OE_09775 [Sphingosinicella sp.]
MYSHDAKTMATPWRRRRMCLAIAGRAAPAALREVSATGAYIETSLKPPLGAAVSLKHPEAGEIIGTVRAITPDGLWLAFSYGSRSVAFAMVAITADMTCP